MIKEVKNTVPWTYVISDLNGEEIIGTFYEKELKKLETFDSSYLRGKSHFEDNSTQNWLVFQQIHRYFKTAGINDSNILS